MLKDVLLYQIDDSVQPIARRMWTVNYLGLYQIDDSVQPIANWSEVQPAELLYQIDDSVQPIAVGVFSLAFG